MSYIPTPPSTRLHSGKKPDIKFCPCCEADATYAQAECIRHPSGDVLLGFVLHWVCWNCGCEWEHGQFSKQEQKAAP